MKNEIFNEIKIILENARIRFISLRILPWSKHVGTVETEAFIYYIQNQSFDYTRWQKEHYDTMTPEAIYQSLEEHSADHPFQGKKAIII